MARLIKAPPRSQRAAGGEEPRARDKELARLVQLSARSSFLRRLRLSRPPSPRRLDQRLLMTRACDNSSRSVDAVLMIIKHFWPAEAVLFAARTCEPAPRGRDDWKTN